MAEWESEQACAASSPSDRLNSWKEIAGYLDVSVRTVMRWEKSEGLPVHRHLHDKIGSLYAHKSELDRWRKTRSDQQGGLALGPPSRAEFAEPSIAVLPFLSLSTLQKDEILSDGLSEELTTILSQIGALRVVARTSCFYFKGKNYDIREVGKRLGVRTVLEGSVRRSGRRLRISAQLISTEDGYHIWSQQYDRKTEDLLDIQEEIARSIAQALQIKLVGETRERIGRRYGRDAEAHVLYLTGLYRMHRMELPAAVECFEKVLAREPNMAPALAGLADCYGAMASMGFLPSTEAFQKAKEAAERALEIDDSLADAHVELGFLWAAEYQWQKAEAELRRALELNPSHALAHIYYGGGILGTQGRLEEASLHVQRAYEADPVSPSVMIGFAVDQLFRRNYDLAIEACERVLELDPRFPLAHQRMGHAYLLQGKYAEAVSALKKIDTPILASGLLGYCYVRLGRNDEALALLQQLQTLPGSVPPPAYQLAILYLGLGDENAALEWLNRAYDSRSWGIHFLKVDPIWDSLRHDRRFGQLLRKMNLPQTD